MTAPDVRAFIMANASTKSRLHTDEAKQYPRIGAEYSNRTALGVDDAERTTRAIRGVSGKRLTYRQPHGSAQG